MSPLTTKALTSAGYEKMTLVQAEALPICLDGMMVKYSVLNFPNDFALSLKKHPNSYCHYYILSYLYFSLLVKQIFTLIPSMIFKCCCVTFYASSVISLQTSFDFNTNSAIVKYRRMCVDLLLYYPST